MAPKGSKQPKKGTSKRKYTHRRGTAEDWIKVQAEYESGGGSMREIAEKYGLSPNAARKRCAKYGWRRADKVPDVRERIYNRKLDIVAEAGMPVQKIIKEIAERALCTKKLANVTRIWKNADGTIVVNPFTGAPVTVTTTIEVIDNEATYRNMVLLVKILGLEAPPKSPVDPPKEEQEPEVEPLDDIPLDRLEAAERALLGA